MTAITGGITPYLNALGGAPDDAAVRALLDAQPADAKSSRYSDPYAHYEVFHDAGTSFLFEEDGLAAVFFYLKSLRGYTAYESEVPLIDGLPERPTFDEVREALGEPYQFDPEDFDVYKVAEGQHVHLEYDMEMRVKIVTLMPRLPRES